MKYSQMSKRRLSSSSPAHVFEVRNDSSTSWLQILQEEFQQLSTGSLEGMPRSYFKPEVAIKNRYYDVLPTEDTRVVLNPVEGVIGSDYINANYVNGEVSNSKDYYIACQAPLASTVEDFWRMIWEKRCGVIVMLTGLDEGNAPKADRYWPSEGKAERYGSFFVLHKKKFFANDIAIRSILIKKTDSNEPAREIIHLHYQGWPDFGVPSCTKVIRNLLILVSKFKSRAAVLCQLEGPVVVHCSAGIGRTGAFIACHITLQKLQHNLTPNIKQTVEILRKQRNGMVRNVAQYALIYSVIKDVLKEKTPEGSLRHSC